MIVRDQSVKQELPEFMKNMLCLTVYESKGLEFEDVILYNFFRSGQIRKEQWKLLNYVKSNQKYRDKLPDWLLDKDLEIGNEDNENEAH